MSEDSTIIYVINIILIIFGIILVYYSLRWSKEDDNNFTIKRNIINDIFLKEVWGIEQPHYDND